MQHKILYSQIKDQIQEGDVILFRGKSLISFFIGRFGQTKYTHVGIASWVNGSGKPPLLELVEFKEGVGGRSSSFDRVVDENSGRMDIYRPEPTWTTLAYDMKQKKIVASFNNFDAKAITNSMRRMTGRAYGWNKIWQFAKRKMFGLRLIYKPDVIMDDTPDDLMYPVCSTAIAHAFNKNGFDLIPNRADAWTEPGQIAMSAHLHYICTIIKDTS